VLIALVASQTEINLKEISFLGAVATYVEILLQFWTSRKTFLTSPHSTCSTLICLIYVALVTFVLKKRALRVIVVLELVHLPIKWWRSVNPEKSFGLWVLCSLIFFHSRFMPIAASDVCTSPIDCTQKTNYLQNLNYIYLYKSRQGEGSNWSNNARES
jgi:hypothetical protein